MYNCPSCGREYPWKKYVEGRHTNAPINAERTIRCSNFLPDGSRCGVVFDVTRRLEVVRRKKVSGARFDEIEIHRHWYSFFLPHKKYVLGTPVLEDLPPTETEYFDVSMRDE